MTLELCTECYDRICRMSGSLKEAYDDVLFAYSEGEIVAFFDDPHLCNFGLQRTVEHLESLGFVQTIDNELGEILVAPTLNKYGVACCKRHISVDLRGGND